MAEKHTGFLGTYFSKTTVLRISNISKILAWIALAVYLFQLSLYTGIDIYQILHGFWGGMSILDMLQNIITSIEQPLHGIVYAFALFGISQILLIFLDIEDNTRRSTRQ